MPLSQVSKRTEELPRVALNVVSHLRRKGCVVWSEAAVEQALYSSLLYRGYYTDPNNEWALCLNKHVDDVTPEDIHQLADDVINYLLNEKLTDELYSVSECAEVQLQLLVNNGIDLSPSDA